MKTWIIIPDQLGIQLATVQIKSDLLAAVSIISTACSWLGRIGKWGGRTGFRA